MGAAAATLRPFFVSGGHMSQEEPLVFPASGGKAALLLVGAVLLVAVCVWIVATAEPDDRAVPVAWVGMIFFGVAALAMAGQLRSDKPALVVSDDGITVNATAFAPGFVAWEEIEEIRLFSVFAQRYIAVTVRDMTPILERQSPHRRLVLGVMSALSRSPVTIPSAAVDTDIGELAELLAARLFERTGRPRRRD